MNLKRAFFILLAGVSFGIPVYPALAKPGYSNTNRYLNFLKQSFTSNQSQEVLENLWQALLVDPYAIEIQPYLQKSLNELSLAAVDRMRVLSVQDLLKQTQNLSERRQYYAQKNDDLKRVILKEGITVDNLEMFLKQLSENVQNTSLNNVSEYFLKNGSSWERLQAMLNDERISLDRDVSELERQYQSLTRLHQHKTFVPASGVSSLAVVTDQKSPEMFSVVSDAQKEEHVSPSRIQPESLQDIRKLVAGLQNQIIGFQQDLQRKNEMINSLRVQVVDMNLNLVQRDKMLNDRINELVDLRGRMDDVQSRFDLGQKIIQEKDIQMDSMQKELSYARNENQNLRKDMAVRLEEKDQRIQEMAGMLDVYWKKLNSVSDSVEKKDDDVNFLMERLLNVQEHLEEKEFALQKTHHDLNDLEGQLKGLQDRDNSSPQMDEVSGQDMLNMEMKLRDVKSYLIQQIEDNDALSHYLTEQQKQLDASLQPSHAGL